MSRVLPVLSVALALACGACTIGRHYVGNSLRSDPHVVLTPGQTTLPQVLEMFGAPERLQRRRSGDILIYRFVRLNNTELEIETPSFIPGVPSITLFIYQKRQLKADRLTLFFDDEGTLTTFGYSGGVNELETL
jgi:hypothetical protein